MDKAFELIKTLETSPIRKKAKLIDDVRDKVWKGLLILIFSGLLLLFSQYVRNNNTSEIDFVNPLMKYENK
jgi:hypothetical protein